MPTQPASSRASLRRFITVLTACLACINAHVILRADRKSSETLEAYSTALDEDHATVPEGLVASPKDEVNLTVRDVSPDLVVSSLPMPKTGGPAAYPPNDTLRLRSSTHSVRGIDGHQLFAVPIFATDLKSLLTDTVIDLKHFKDVETTKFYHFNGTGWSFYVSAPYANLQYSLIKAIAARFLKLASVSPSTALSTTRTGVLFNGSRPLAEIVIMPNPRTVKSSYVPFAKFGEEHPLSSTPVEVISIDPFGTTCARDVVNESTALAPFFNTGANQNLTTRDLAGGIILRIAVVGFAMGVQLMHEDFHNFVNALDANDLMALDVALDAQEHQHQLHEVVVRVGTTLSHAICWLAVMHTYYPYILYAIPMYMQGTGPLQALDTGFYVLRNLAMRLVMETTKRDDHGELTMLKPETWRSFIQRLIPPLDYTYASNSSAWAMEGKLYGPESGDKGLDDGTDGDHNNQVVIGRWQLWIGDSGFIM